MILPRPFDLQLPQTLWLGLLAVSAVLLTVVTSNTLSRLGVHPAIFGCVLFSTLSAVLFAAWQTASWRAAQASRALRELRGQLGALARARRQLEVEAEGRLLLLGDKLDGAIEVGGRLRQQLTIMASRCEVAEAELEDWHTGARLWLKYGKPPGQILALVAPEPAEAPSRREDDARVHSGGAPFTASQATSTGEVPGLPDGAVGAGAGAVGAVEEQAATKATQVWASAKVSDPRLATLEPLSPGPGSSRHAGYIRDDGQLHTEVSVPPPVRPAPLPSATEILEDFCEDTVETQVVAGLVYDPYNAMKE